MGLSVMRPFIIQVFIGDIAIPFINYCATFVLYNANGNGTCFFIFHVGL